MEILGQTHQRVVNAGVAVGMVPAQHGAHGGGALAEGPVVGEVVFIHGVKDAPVDGLQAVPHVGQRPSHDDRHGVFDIALLHLGDKLALPDHLVGKGDLLGLIVFIFMGHLLSPP